MATVPKTRSETRLRHSWRRLVAKDGVEARVIGGAHHDGHGIFSAEWTTARTDEEEAEAALVGALEEAPKIRMDTPESVRRFKPIGASTPEVDFRWKTEEEEAREEEVAEFLWRGASSASSSGRRRWTGRGTPRGRAEEA